MNNQENTVNNNWIARPLGRTGNLNSWNERMKAACPNPELGMVVWLENEENSIGYKVIDLRGNGDPIWQRGQVIARH